MELLPLGRRSSSGSPEIGGSRLPLLLLLLNILRGESGPACGIRATADGLQGGDRLGSLPNAQIPVPSFREFCLNVISPRMYSVLSALCFSSSSCKQELNGGTLGVQL